MQYNQDLESRGQMDQLLWDSAEEKKQTEFDIMELLYHLVDKLIRMRDVIRTALRESLFRADTTMWTDTIYRVRAILRRTIPL